MVQSLMMAAYDIDHALVSLFWDKAWKEKLEGAIKQAVPKLKKVNEIYQEKSTALEYFTLADLLYA